LPGSQLTNAYPRDPDLTQGVPRSAIGWVQLDSDAAAADQDHVIAPEERFRLAMARQ
jgi:hypothetical protein